MSNDLDTFQSPAWNTQVSTDMNSQEEGLDTFSSGEVILPEEENGEEQEQTEEKQVQKQSKAKGKEDSQTNHLPDQDDDGEVEEEGESRSANSDGDKPEDGADREDASEADKEATTAKLDGKTIRIKEGDKAVDLNEESTVPVRVNGRKQFVPMKELISNYSGKVAFDKKFEEIENTKKEFNTQKEQFDSEKQVVVDHFSKIGGMLQSALTDPESDPVAAMKYLVEISGNDVLKFEKRLVEHYSNIVHGFDDMDDSEQGLYWSRRENEILRNHQTTQAKLAEERTAKEQLSDSQVKLREQYGVSDTEYTAAQEKLSSLGYDLKGVTPEQVCKFHVLGPLVEKATGLCEQFEDDLGDEEMSSLIRDTANTMYQYKGISEYDALKMAAKNLGFEIEDESEHIKTLQEKAAKPKDVLADKKKENQYKYGNSHEEKPESFDDFDNF